MDVTVLKLIDGTKAYLHAIIDNYSRKTLAWTVAERLNPTANCQLLLAAAKHMVFAGRPLLFADSGIENINSAVDDTCSNAAFGILWPNPGRDVLRHGGPPAGATGVGPEQGTGGAPCCESRGDL